LGLQRPLIEKQLKKFLERTVFERKEEKKFIAYLSNPINLVNLIYNNPP